jgi:riboflavin kinase
MMVTPHERDSIDYNELATLKELALDGGLERAVHVSCSELSGKLSVSSQTVSRRLRELEDTSHIDRELVDDGQLVAISQKGASVLQREYHQYQQLFEAGDDPTVAGTVTDGMGEGKHYISLDGYQRQFEDRLGYVPYPGTLNVAVDEEDVHIRDRVMETVEGIRIDEWSDDERTYGAATCYPVTIDARDDCYDRAHVLVPDRTHHDDQIVEIIAPVELRAELSITAGSEVSLRVAE